MPEQSRGILHALGDAEPRRGWTVQSRRLRGDEDKDREEEAEEDEGEEVEGGTTHGDLRFLD